MRQLEKTVFLHTSDSVTVYWDKPKELPADYQYHIMLDGELVGVTGRTHFTCENLAEAADYELQVRVVSGQEVMNRRTAAQEDDAEEVKAAGSGTGKAQAEETEAFHTEEMIWAASEQLHVKTDRRKKCLDVTKAPYFAAGDGVTMNTAALQKAIDDCTAQDMVYLPAGEYLTGALRLHSDMELYLEEGAVLQGTDRVEDYLPRIWSRFEGTELFCYSSLLNLGELDHNGGYSCKNVVIRGKGTIASGGRVLAERVIAFEQERLKDYLDSLGDKIQECERLETIPGRVRPRLINMSNCRNIRISGLTLKNGASWNVHMIYSDHIITDNCTFYSRDVWNGDGWDPDSSSHCTIFGCEFYTGDDSIAVKSGKNPEGNVIGRPCEHIRIFDCSCAFGHGITIGSEMSGGVRDVSIWDCDMSSSLCGIEIKGTKKRGGYVREVWVRDCKTARILFHSVGYNDDGEGAPHPPVFEQCVFEHLQITGECLDHDGQWKDCEAIELCGFDEPGHELRDIIFRDVAMGKEGMNRKQTISMQLCGNITFEKLRCV